MKKKGYVFKFSKKADEDFGSLSKQLRKRIFIKLEHFEKLDEPLSLAKKLEGTNNKYRFRVGDYRIIVSKLDENTLIILLILKIAHRKNVYE